MSFEEDFLAHFGKKGMKWGQRKAYAKENPNFKRDVKRTMRGQGLEKLVEIENVPEVPGLIKITEMGKYRDSVTKKAVGKKYAEKVIEETNRRNSRNNKILTAGLIAGGAVITARILSRGL